MLRGRSFAFAKTPTPGCGVTKVLRIYIVREKQRLYEPRGPRSIERSEIVWGGLARPISARRKGFFAKIRKWCEKQTLRKELPHRQTHPRQPTPNFLVSLGSSGAPGALFRFANTNSTAGPRVKSSRFHSKFHPGGAGWNTNAGAPAKNEEAANGICQGSALPIEGENCRTNAG